jgi:hypothetical protein
MQGGLCSPYSTIHKDLAGTAHPMTNLLRTYALTSALRTGE